MKAKAVVLVKIALAIHLLQGPASGAPWDVQLVCPAGDWVLNTTVTLTCSLMRTSVPAKCTGLYEEIAQFSVTPRPSGANSTVPSCSVSNFTSCGPSQSVDDGCWCWNETVNMYTFQYKFVASHSHEGYWGCYIHCWDTTSVYPLNIDSVNCSNKSVKGNGTTPVPNATPAASTTPLPNTTPTPTTTSGPSTLYVTSTRSIKSTTSVSSFTRVTSTAPSTTLASCAAGHFTNANDNGRCTPCPVGQYQEGTNQSDCKKCPAASTTQTTGAVNMRACEALPEVRNTASVRLRYVLTVVCTHEDEVRTSSEVHANFVIMQSDWSGLCSDSECSNAHVTSTCEGPTLGIITSVTAVEEVAPTLTSRVFNITLPTNDALLQAILQTDRFKLQETTGARLLTNEVSVSMTWACRPGYLRSRDSCDPVAASKTGPSAELIGSIAGGGVGLVGVVLLIVLVVRQVRTPAAENRSDWTPQDGRNPTHQHNACRQGTPRTERKFRCTPTEDPPEDYHYSELQDNCYLTPVGTTTKMTSLLESSRTPKPELPSRDGVRPLNGVMENVISHSENAAADDSEIVFQASVPSRPLVHTRADASGYITPTYEDNKASC